MTERQTGRIVFETAVEEWAPERGGNNAPSGEDRFVINTLETQGIEVSEVPIPIEASLSKRNASVHPFIRRWLRSLRQLLRFGVVGMLNTLIDLLALNGLLFLFPTTGTVHLLAYNSLAYSLGAANSFFLNKYWTFKQRQPTARGELMRFATATLLGIGWSSVILWLASHVLHPVIANPVLWANASKVLAIGGTVLISYLEMRLWVFVHHAPKQSVYYESNMPR
jgi:putative flippase GtrA